MSETAAWNAAEAAGRHGTYVLGTGKIRGGRRMRARKLGSRRRQDGAGQEVIEFGVGVGYAGDDAGGSACRHSLDSVELPLGGVSAQEEERWWCQQGLTQPLGGDTCWR